VRGGSKGISRKNARLLAGKPLLYYAIRTALSSHRFAEVAVTTEDEELGYLAGKFGARVIQRPPHLAGDDVGLDEVVADAVASLERETTIDIDVVATLQATSPTLGVATVQKAVDMCLHGETDTVVSVVDDRHLAWIAGEDGALAPEYERRVNRQHLPERYRETGSIVVCRRSQLHAGTRFGRRITPVVLDKREAIDIDDRFDWWLAEMQLRRKHVVFRVEGHDEIGLGHVYRCLTLADHMLSHDVTFVVSARSDLALKMLASRFYEVVEFAGPDDEIEAIRSCGPDVVVNDILDTSAEYVRALKNLGVRVVNLEDQGSGRQEADAVINAMYGSSESANVHSGLDYVCLRDEFYACRPIRIRRSVQNLLVLFGGTDPSGLTVRVVEWLQRMGYGGEVTVITGPGYPAAGELERRCAGAGNIRVVSDTRIISKYMGEADLAVTSAGRAIFELAYLGVPMIVACQNEREQAHVMARDSRGVVNLGLGRDVSYEVFRRELSRLLDSPQERRAMHEALLSHRLKNGIRNVWRIILRTRG
jgi:spore coat polysaccharide biosynthesis predicted glycosyltransferase SpsG/CMP-N-acetylneuraminic acid synthetase